MPLPTALDPLPPTPLALAALLGLTVLVTLALGLLSHLTTQALRAGFRPPSNPLLNPVDMALRLGLILLLAGAAWLAGVSPARLGWTLHGWLRQAGGGIVIGVMLAWLLRRLGQAGASMDGSATSTGFQPEEVVRLILPRSRREGFLVLLALFPAALLEELLFRSLWIGAASLVWPSWLMLALSALLFGLMHTAQGRVGVVATTLAGFLFGALFLWSGSLLLPLVAHYVANAVQVIWAARSLPAPPTSPGA
jgi:membrane protease YdiL (CAAX protease family)